MKFGDLPNEDQLANIGHILYKTILDESTEYATIEEHIQNTVIVAFEKDDWAEICEILGGEVGTKLRLFLA